jgi:hypothetical protein
MKVPQLFVATGATTFGRDSRQCPVDRLPPSYAAEGIIHGKYILSDVTRPTIAVLDQDDDCGRQLVAGPKRGLGSSRAGSLRRGRATRRRRTSTRRCPRSRPRRRNVFTRSSARRSG